MKDSVTMAHLSSESVKAEVGSHLKMPFLFYFFFICLYIQQLCVKGTTNKKLWKSSRPIFWEISQTTCAVFAEVLIPTCFHHAPTHLIVMPGSLAHFLHSSEMTQSSDSVKIFRTAASKTKSGIKKEMYWCPNFSIQIHENLKKCIEVLVGCSSNSWTVC